MKCKDCFLYSVYSEECNWYDVQVNEDDCADCCPNFDYYPSDKKMNNTYIISGYAVKRKVK